MDYSRHKLGGGTLKDDRAPLVNEIDYERQKLGESDLRINHAPLVYQIDYEWHKSKKMISEPIVLHSLIKMITSVNQIRRKCLKRALIK